MYQDPTIHTNQTGASCRRAVSVLVWLAIGTGWLVSIFTVIEEMCLATACRDTASFTFFGANMGLLGIGYFSLALLLLWLRKRYFWLDWLLFALVFAGVGAELRLLWIQKFVIGSWCPLCVTISLALFASAILLLIGNKQEVGSWTGRGVSLLTWGGYLLTMVVVGLVVAIIGVQPLV